jgi:hypothetical protein
MGSHLQQSGARIHLTGAGLHPTSARAHLTGATAAPVPAPTASTREAALHLAEPPHEATGVPTAVKQVGSSSLHLLRRSNAVVGMMFGAALGANILRLG